MKWPKAMLLLDTYVLKKILPIVMMFLMVAAFVLMLDKIMTLLNLTAGHGVSPLIAIEMMLSQTPEYLRVGTTIGLFLGVILGFRSLSMNSEFLVIQSSGISLRRVLRPVLWLCIVGFGSNLALSGYVEPLARYAYSSLYFDVTNGVIDSGVGEGIFVNVPGGYTIRAQETRMGGRKLYGVFVAYNGEDGSVEAYTAKQGVLTTVKKGDLVLRLLDGERIEEAVDSAERHAVRFEVCDLPFSLNNSLHFRDRGDDERELTLGELLRLYMSGLLSSHWGSSDNLLSHVPESARSIHFSAIAAEVNHRLAYALSIFIVPFFAAPLGITSPRSSRYGGLAIGSIGILAFQKTLEFVSKAAAVDNIPAALSIWSVYVAFALLTVVLFVSTSRDVNIAAFSHIEDITAEYMHRLSVRLSTLRFLIVDLLWISVRSFSQIRDSLFGLTGRGSWTAAKMTAQVNSHACHR